MCRLLLVIVSLLQLNTQSNAQVSINVSLNDSKGAISRHIFGQFSEHLGRGVYEGIWVGENSDIPNEEGYRIDVLEALHPVVTQSIIEKETIPQKSGLL